MYIIPGTGGWSYILYLEQEPGRFQILVSLHFLQLENNKYKAEIWLCPILPPAPVDSDHLDKTLPLKGIQT